MPPPSTKQYAIEKLEKLKGVIGMPDKLIDDPVLKYTPDDPWRNMALIGAWRRKKIIELEGKDVIDIPEIDWNKFKLIDSTSLYGKCLLSPN